MPTLTDLRHQLDGYWSQSRINTFLMCSLKYAFQYVYKIESQHLSSALPFGNAVHRTLEMMARTQMEGQPMSKVELQELFRDIWSRQIEEGDQTIRYKAGEDRDTLAETGIGIVGAFRDSMNEREEVLSVSQALAVPISGLTDPLIGEMDLLVSSDEGKPVIVDWKTAARRWGKGKAHSELQPTALIYAYNQQFGETPEFEYRIGTKAKTPSYQVARTTRDETDMSRFVKLVKTVDRAVRNEIFIPSDGCWCCSDCQFSTACREWSRKNATSVSIAA